MTSSLRPPRRQQRSAPRRRQIIEAALACFTEHGLTAAAVPEIARRAHASIGSIYHQFGSKEGVAAAVYLEGLRRYQDGMVECLGGIQSAREGIGAMVRFHLGWVETNMDWARFLFEARRAEFMRSHEEEIRQINREFGQGMAVWFRPHMLAGRLRPLPVDLLLALLLGPCHEYVRGWMGGRAVTPRDEAERVLGQAVWRAVGVEHASKAEEEPCP